MSLWLCAFVSYVISSFLFHCVCRLHTFYFLLYMNIQQGKIEKMANHSPFWLVSIDLFQFFIFWLGIKVKGFKDTNIFSWCGLKHLSSFFSVGYFCSLTRDIRVNLKNSLIPSSIWSVYWFICFFSSNFFPYCLCRTVWLNQVVSSGPRRRNFTPKSETEK